MDLPQFTYHPNPLDTGSIVAWEGVCEVCGQLRKFAYKGPIYCASERRRFVRVHR